MIQKIQNSKITDHHLHRTAIIYLRQSTDKKVMRNNRWNEHREKNNIYLQNNLKKPVNPAKIKPEATPEATKNKPR